MNRLICYAVTLAVLTSKAQAFVLPGSSTPRNVIGVKSQHKQTRLLRANDVWSLSSTALQTPSPASPWFSDNENDVSPPSKEKLKTQILQLGAALDRG